MNRTVSTSEDTAEFAKLRQRSGTSSNWLVLAITALAAILRLAYLGHKSLWLDEAVSVSLARLDWRSFEQTLWLREGNMALYYLLLRPFVALNQSEWCVRLLSTFAGIATVPVMFKLGTRLFGRRAGLLSALLFAVNACSVVYSQEARGYSLVVLLVAAATLQFVRSIEQPSYWNWAAYALVAALSVYAHFFALLVIAAQWLSLPALPRPLIPVRKLIVALGFGAVLSIPAFIFILTKNIGQLSWVMKPSWLELYHLALFLSAEGGKVIGNILLVLFLIALIVAARSAFVAWRTRGRSLESWRYALVFSCLLTPVILALLASLRTPLFFHRFLIVCLPAFVLLVALGLSQLRPSPIMAALFVGLSIAASFTSYSRTREDWRAATKFVLSQAQSQTGKPLFFFQSWGKIPFDYYRAQMSDTANVPLEEIPLKSLDQLSNQHVSFWVVIYPLPKADPVTKEIESGLNSRFPCNGMREFRGLKVIRCDTPGH